MQMFVGKIAASVALVSMMAPSAGQAAGSGMTEANPGAPMRQSATAQQVRLPVRPSVMRPGQIARPVEAERMTRVILTLSDRAVGGSAPRAGDAEAIKAEFPRLAAAQERMMGQLRAMGLSELKPIRNSRYIAASGTERAIRAVVASQAIAAATPDTLLRPAVQHSVPATNPPPIRDIFLDGRNQIVAILDTGVMENHAFLAGKKRGEACFSTTSTSSGSTAICTDGSTASGAGAPCTLSQCEHGTHLAGIAVGRDPGGAGHHGMAYAAGYYSIQIYSNVGGSLGAWTSDTLGALMHVRDRKLAGDRIVALNLSSGGTLVSGPCGGPQETAFAQLRALGVAPVTSAGNNGSASGVTSPACAPNAITVSAVRNDGSIPPYSNFSPMVDLLAPGDAITSAITGSPTQYGSRSGTSAASPHVAGAFALLRQIYGCYSVDELELALKTHGVATTGPSGSGTFSRIDLKAAMDALGQPDPRKCATVRVRALDIKAEAVM